MADLSPANRIDIAVDRALCIGSGDCVDTAPDVFQLDDEDKAVVGRSRTLQWFITQQFKVAEVLAAVPTPVMKISFGERKFFCPKR